jgi:hypothetical protein
VSWTTRFTLGVIAAVALVAIETDWYGLLPGSSRDLIADACVLALIALYAVRASTTGAAIALFCALWVLYLDQATVGIGVPPLPFVPPIDFWLSTVLRAALAWSAFALVTAVVARRLPERAIGVAVAAGLLVLPFLRYNEWDYVVTSYLDPFGQRLVVLQAPWLPVVALAATVVTLIALAEARWRRVLLVATAVLSIVAPSVVHAADDFHLTVGVEVAPPVAGPLDKVTIRAKFPADSAVEAFWDGDAMIAGPGLTPRPQSVQGVTTFTFYPGAQSQIGTGRHDLQVAAGLDARQVTVTLRERGSGLAIEVQADGGVSVHGRPEGRAQVLVRDDAGTLQLLEIALGPQGVWSAPTALPSGHFRVVAQSGLTWTATDATVR